LDTLRFCAETYDVHLGFIGKHVVDFLLVLIELFLAMRYGWGATTENRSKIGDFAPTGTGWPKISGTILLLRKLGLDPSYGIRIWTDISSVLSQCTRLTDGHTAFFWLDRPCI